MQMNNKFVSVKCKHPKKIFEVSFVASGMEKSNKFSFFFCRKGIKLLYFLWHSFNWKVLSKWRMFFFSITLFFYLRWHSRQSSSTLSQRQARSMSKMFWAGKYCYQLHCLWYFWHLYINIKINKLQNQETQNLLTSGDRNNAKIKSLIRQKQTKTLRNGQEQTDTDSCY